MAMTATIALTPTTAIINQNVNVAVTVSNSAATAVNVTKIIPYANITSGVKLDANSAVAFGSPVTLLGGNVQVASSGTRVFNFDAVFFSPSTGPIGSGSGTFDVSAVVYSDDGSVFSPTAATVTVNPIALPVSEQ